MEAARIVAELQRLGYPHLMDIAESSEVIFLPGERRIRLLAWLLLRFDATLDVVDTTEAKQHAKIASALNILGLCPNEPGYSSGASGGRDVQLRILAGLLDRVNVATNGTLSRFCQFDRIAANGEDALEAEFAKSTKLIEWTARNHHAIFSNDPGLGDNKSKQPGKVPSTEHLNAGLRQLEDSLARLSAQLKDPNYTRIAPTSAQREQLGIEFNRLEQKVSAFRKLYDDEVKQWIPKSAPPLSGVGPASQRLWDAHSKVMRFLADLRRMQNEMAAIERLQKWKPSPAAETLFSDKLDDTRRIIDAACARRLQSV